MWWKQWKIWYTPSHNLLWYTSRTLGLRGLIKGTKVKYETICKLNLKYLGVQNWLLEFYFGPQRQNMYFRVHQEKKVKNHCSRIASTQENRRLQKYIRTKQNNELHERHGSDNRSFNIRTKSWKPFFVRFFFETCLVLLTRKKLQVILQTY